MTKYTYSLNRLNSVGHFFCSIFNAFLPDYVKALGHFLFGGKIMWMPELEVVKQKELICIRSNEKQVIIHKDQIDILISWLKEFKNG